MTSDHDPAWKSSVMINREQQMSRLRSQAWTASSLLYGIWLISSLFWLPQIRDTPVTIFFLLVGLAVAINMHRILFQHLNQNHRPGKEQELFSTLGAANWMTLLRAGAVVALAGFLPLCLSESQELPKNLLWVPAIMYLIVSLADLLDGLVARKLDRISELGIKLDIETDAAGLMTASLLAISCGRLPLIYILVGLAYYLFSFGIWVRQKRARCLVKLQSRPYARIIAGFQMGLIAVVLMPLFNPVFTRLAGLIIMAPLLLGFLRDWLVVSCRLQTDVHQLSPLDYWIGNVVMRKMVLALRGALLAGFVSMLLRSDIYQLSFGWLAIYSFGCLFAVSGFLCRSSCLLLILLLGSELSVFGTTFSAKVIFTIGVVLMLSGSGSFSLWSPEESILYRCRPKDPLGHGEP